MKTLFLAGDVMTGRGIDQVLPFPSAPILYEDYIRDALGYVELAVQASGEIRRPVDFSYIWGDALAELRSRQVDARIVNLETAVTRSDTPWPHKGINYRMHPANVQVLTTARIDCCTLANNHVLDWGQDGLIDTITALRQARIMTAGAGRNAEEAGKPASVPLGGSARVLVWSRAHQSSGVPRNWAATDSEAGVALLPDFSGRSVELLGKLVRDVKRTGDTAVASLHWGPNWDYDIGDDVRLFAHELIDSAGIDLVHGHSSHHVKGIEVYHGHLILYGCGDLINDYEGIPGFRMYRGDLSLMYLASVGTEDGRLVRLEMVPMTMKRFRLTRTGGADARALAAILDREGQTFGTSVFLTNKETLELRW